MNSDQRDVQAPSHPECLLPSVAHTSSVSQVTPAKKVTFLKRGDPRFAGVRLAVHRRAFKTFSSLMDELSQRMPLSFGVRSVTTPRGLHGLSTLEQLQDGGCYLCSDKKPPETPRRPGRPQARRRRAVQSWDVEGQHEEPGTSSSWRDPAAPRRVMLVKNGDARCQQMLILSHRDTRSLTAFLSRASDLLHFPVKQVYTVSGRKVDPLQALLHGPSMLVCAGNEAFKPLAVGSTQRGRTEALSALTPSNKNSFWGPKAKPSVIHSRSRSGSRPPQSARSGLSEPPPSLPRAWLGPAPPGPLVTGDDVEKKVCMNEDGSLSVEMRVRLHLLGKDTLLESQRMERASTLMAASGEGRGLGEVDPNCYRWERNPWDSLESGVRGPGLCKTGCQGAFDESQQPRPSCEIWRNPLCVPQGERPAPRRRSGRAQGRKRHSKDYSSPNSSAEHPECSEPDSCSPRSPESHAGSDSPCPASEAASLSGAEREAGEAWCLEGMGPPGWGKQGCQGPRTQGEKGPLSDSSASAKSHEESGEWGGQQWGCLAQSRARTSQRKATHGDSPCPSSLNNQDLQTEKHGQGTGCHKPMDGPVTMAPGWSGCWDAEGITFPILACAPAQPGRRGQESPGSAASSLSIPDPHQGTQKGHTGLCSHCRDTYCPIDSPAAPLAPRPPDRGNSFPGGPVPRFSPKSSSSRQASGNLRSPHLGSPDPQDLTVASGAAVIPMSSSDWASGFYHSRACSAELAEDTECRVRSPAHIPAYVQGAGSLGDKTGSTLRPSSPLVLQVGWPEGEKPGAGHSCCSSQTVACPVLGTPSGHTEACWACSGYCPTPPEGWPCPKRDSSNSRSNSSGYQRAEKEGPGASEPGEENLKARCVLSPGPKPGPMGRAVRRAGRSPSPGSGAGIEGTQEDGDVPPSTLPHASPDAVVREWLKNIPEEPILLRYEIADENTPMVPDSPGGAKEDAGDTRQQLLEGDPDEHTGPGQAFPGTVDAGPKLGDGSQQGAGLGEVPQTPAKARVGGGASVGCGVTSCVLPSRVSASVQIMKALMGSKQGRPSSLPEVSGPVAQRLSHSAEALIACLARLHFFDDTLGSPVDKGTFEDSPRYQELLSLPWSLWPGCDLGQGPLHLGLKKLTAFQALPVTKDSTPTSSSGVDISSGSGGSGEGSVPCAVDATLVPEQTEWPLQISSERPDSRSLGRREHRANPQQSCSTASSGSPEPKEPCSSSGQQTLGSYLEQLDDNPETFVENTMQKERGQAEETEERERPQEEGIQEEGLPEEAGVSRQEEATGRGPASSALDPSARREKHAESAGHLGKGDSNASESHSDPKSEPSLDTLPRAAVLGQGQAGVKSTLDPVVTSPPTTCTASLDPDPIWVSKLLKKMEEAFMTHLAGATAELRARWSLQDNSLLDQMVVELQQDVGRRLRDSTDKELQKIQSRAGRMAQGSLREVLKRQASLQTRQRRRRLQGLRDLSAFPQQNRQEPPFLTLEGGPNASAARGTGPGRQAEGDEFCPCETCVRKKVTPRSPNDTTEAASAPVKKAFDLQQILQQKRGEAAEGAPERAGSKQPQEDPTAQRAARGQELGLGLGSQRQSSDPELGVTEGDGNQEREEEEAVVWERGGRAHTSVNREEAEGLEKGAREQEGATLGSSRDRDAPEAARGQGNGGKAAEGQLDSGGHDGEKEGGPGVSTGQGRRGEAPGNSSLDQERKLTTPRAQAGDAPYHRPGPQTSLRSCSQVSQRSLEDQSGRDLGCPDAPQAAGKVTTMYPESSASEEEEALGAQGLQSWG